jgi:hypothetical protein
VPVIGTGPSPVIGTGPLQLLCMGLIGSFLGSRRNHCIGGQTLSTAIGTGRLRSSSICGKFASACLTIVAEGGVHHDRH